MAFDVDLLAAGETPFEILGQNTGGAEPSDQLPARFRTQFGAALVDQMAAAISRKRRAMRSRPSVSGNVFEPFVSLSRA